MIYVGVVIQYRSLVTLSCYATGPMACPSVVIMVQWLVMMYHSDGIKA